MPSRRALSARLQRDDGRLPIPRLLCGTGEEDLPVYFVTRALLIYADVYIYNENGQFLYGVWNL